MPPYRQRSYYGRRSSKPNLGEALADILRSAGNQYAAYRQNKEFTDRQSMLDRIALGERDVAETERMARREERGVAAQRTERQRQFVRSQTLGAADIAATERMARTEERGIGRREDVRQFNERESRLMKMLNERIATGSGAATTPATPSSRFPSGVQSLIAKNFFAGREEVTPGGTFPGPGGKMQFREEFTTTPQVTGPTLDSLLTLIQGAQGPRISGGGISSPIDPTLDTLPTQLQGPRGAVPPNDGSLTPDEYRLFVEKWQSGQIR